MSEEAPQPSSAISYIKDLGDVRVREILLGMAPEQIAAYYEATDTVYNALISGTSDPDMVGHFILTYITTNADSGGLSYDRATLWLMSHDPNLLVYNKGVGPRDGKHANEVWSSIIDRGGVSLADSLTAYEHEKVTALEASSI